MYYENLTLLALTEVKRIKMYECDLLENNGSDPCGEIKEKIRKSNFKIKTYIELGADEDKVMQQM